MDFKLKDVAVTNNTADHRFEVTVGGLTGLITYVRFPDRIVYNHTEVPPALEGRGLAAKLAKTALDFARDNHLLVVPNCSYVASYIQKHPEYQDLVSG
jgi:predicted GNAT family acetyltransferase